jgi:hypothetical protein
MIKVLAVAWWLKGWQTGVLCARRKSMSRWPIIGKSRTAMAVLLLLSCMLLFQAGSASTNCVKECFLPDPDIKDVKLYVDCDYEFCISFYTQPAMIGPSGNAFYVFFDDKVVIEPNLDKNCVLISWDGHTPKSADKVEVYTGSNLPDFAPACAATAVKIWVPEKIASNSDVTICFTCGISRPCDPAECPYGDCPTCEGSVCDDFVVYVANDATRCPVMSTRYVKIIASAGNGGHVTYPPTGESAPPDFTKMFEVGSEPTYLITGESHIIDKIKIEPLCEGVADPSDVTYNDGTVQATYTFAPLHCDYKITGTFVKKPVYGYLKYQLPQSECGDIVKVKVYGTNKIQPMLNFTDDLYNGGISADFRVEGWDSGTVFYTYDNAGNTDGTTSSGEIPEVIVISPPTENPETYKVTYDDDDPLTGPQYATITILPNGQWVWAPYLPHDVTNIVSIESQRPAWQMVTQNYLDCNKDWEGLIGMVVEVDNGTYKETIEIDTPGVHLKNKDGASPVIDAKGLTPKGDGDKTGAVFLSAGCTGIEGFSIKDSKTNGVLVSLTSSKCKEARILDSIKEPGCSEKGCKEIDCRNITVPCCRGRVNIVKNDIFNNCENGIYVNGNAVVLISENKIHDNIDDGIDAGCLQCGVECIDPKAITHGPACSEIVYNTIYHNGHFPETGMAPKGEWEVVDAQGQKHFTSDPTACGALPGWTDAGIQIRCVGDPCGKPCTECEQDSAVEQKPCSIDLCTAGECCSGTCPLPDFPATPDGCHDCYGRLYIKYNNITANYDAGIYLMIDATQGGHIIIQENQIHENRIFGLLTEAANPERIDFKWNDIWCNRYWGVKNLACCDLIAKENYWGSVGGPSAGPAPIVNLIECRSHEVDQRSDALGNGDEVSHRVHYNPWLYSPWICLDGSCGKAMMFGSDTLILQCGWNTLSAPIKLAPEGDTFREIAGLGKYITQDNFVWVLRWDAKTDKWVDAGASGEQITPGTGYYIKMKAESKFPIIYNAGPSPGLNSVPLESGWNLIGTTWGIDRVNGCCDLGDEGRWAIASPDLEDDEAFMQVTDALESIKDGMNGDRGVAIIVSPSVSGQYEAWSAPVTTGFWDPAKNVKSMATGEAYWVFMVNPSTYAGFEITPFYYKT